MSYIPLFIDADRAAPILIVGGGEIAAAKAEALIGVGARVEIIAVELGEALQVLCKNYAIPVQIKPYVCDDLAGRKIVVAATNDDHLNEQIAFECRQRGILINVVDNPPLCDFIFPALVRRGALQIAISTSGISPVLARLVKHKIEMLIPAQFEQVIDFLQEKKNIIRGHLSKLQPRRLFYEQIIRGAVSEDLMEGNIARADAAFSAALKQFPNENRAALYLVGTGPGNPDLMTIKAVRVLSQADVVLYDRLIPPDILEQYARKDALKIAVGKTRCHHHKKQETIDEMIEHHLKAGRNVVRLKGGDPGIYAHGAEEIAVAKRVGAPYHIVPGVSAANGCAAYAGIPLTERGGALSVRFLTLYKDQLENEEFWNGLRGAQNETLVFYMSTHNYALLCDALIGQGFAPDTPFLIIEQGTTAYQKDYAGTLGEFKALYAHKDFASPCLMIIGDVVKWRDAHHWKEHPAQEGEYFMPLPPKETLEEAA